MTRRGGLRFRLLTLALSVGLALLLAELGLRLIWVPPSLRSTTAFEGHPVYLWWPIPGIEGLRATSEYEHRFRHTAQGLRSDRTFRRQRPPGVARRVLFLGDSFTYGVGVGDDETFVARLAAAWPDFEIANAGCNAYGTRQSLAVLDHFGEAFRPDLTVLVFFWNDLGDNLKHAVPEFDVDAEGRVVRLDDGKRGAGDPLALHPAPPVSLPSRWKASYLRRLVKEGLRGFRYRFLGPARRFIRTAEQKERAWQVTARYLELLRRRAQELGSELIVASIPGQSRIDPSLRIRNIEPLHYEIEERLDRVCDRLGVTYLDLTRGLLEAWQRSGADLYYYADQHLTPAGHRVVAELLRPVIEGGLSHEDAP